MPANSAKKVYGKLSDNNLPATFTCIEDEVHQYKNYDVFPVIDTWLTSNFRSLTFILQKTDSLMIEKYAQINELTDGIPAIPYEGGHKLINLARRSH